MVVKTNCFCQMNIHSSLSTLLMWTSWVTQQSLDGLCSSVSFFPVSTATCCIQMKSRPSLAPKLPEVTEEAETITILWVRSKSYFFSHDEMIIALKSCCCWLWWFSPFYCNERIICLSHTIMIIRNSYILSHFHAFTKQLTYTVGSTCTLMQPAVQHIIPYITNTIDCINAHRNIIHLSRNLFKFPENLAAASSVIMTEEYVRTYSIWKWNGHDDPSISWGLSRGIFHDIKQSWSAETNTRTHKSPHGQHRTGL